jgi:hypothetical protein
VKTWIIRVAAIALVVAFWGAVAWLIWRIW